MEAFLQSSHFHLKSFYPKWNDGNASYCVPTMSRGTYEGPDPDNLGWKQTNAANRRVKNFHESLKGTKGELLVVNALTAFAEVTGEQMFTIHGFDLRNETSKHPVAEDVQDLEVDVFAFVKRLGIMVIFEAKGAEKLKQNRFTDAKKQLFEKEESLNKIVAKTLGSKIKFPVIKVVAFSFADKSQNKQMDCNLRYLGKEVQNFDEFHTWWLHNINSEELSNQDVNLIAQFNDVLAIILGLRSMKFLLPCLNLMNVYQVIDSQQFYELPYEKQSQYKLAPEVIVDAGEIELFKAKNQWLFLNSDQLAIAECTATKLVVAGPPGTGKTILLQHRALQLLCNNPSRHRVVILTLEALLPKYQDFFKASGLDFAAEGSLTFLSMENFIENTDAYADLLESSVLLVDEFQKFFWLRPEKGTQDDMLPIYKIFREILLHSESWWIACMNLMHEYWRELSSEPSKHDEPEQRFINFLENLRSQDDIQFYQMQISVRGTRQNLEHWNFAFMHIRPELETFKPILGNNVMGCPVEYWHTCCAHLSEQLNELIAYLLRAPQKLCESFGVKLNPRDIAIVYFPETKVRSVIATVHEQLHSIYHIETRKISEVSKNAVAFDWVLDIDSYDLPVVISIATTTQNNRNVFPIIAHSRAICKLVMIYVHNDDEIRESGTQVMCQTQQRQLGSMGGMSKLCPCLRTEVSEEDVRNSNMVQCHNWKELSGDELARLALKAAIENVESKSNKD